MSHGVRSRLRTVQWPVVLWAAVVWVALWGDLSVANVLAGAVLGLVVLVLFPQPALSFSGRVRPGGLLRLLGRFFWDLVVASAQVTVLVLSPRTPTSAVVEVRLRTPNLSYLVMTAELITLVPGSMVVEVRTPTRSLFVHALDVDDVEGAERARREAMAQEERVVRAFGTDEEIAMLERGDPSGRGDHVLPGVEAGADPRLARSPDRPAGAGLPEEERA